jgi:uncharacterized membrane protein YcaP (DUF421 family)
LAISWAVARSTTVSRWIEGKCVRLATDGKLDEKQRLFHLISVSDLEEALRKKGLESISQAKVMTLEPSGEITIVKAVTSGLATDREV